MPDLCIHERSFENEHHVYGRSCDSRGNHVEPCTAAAELPDESRREFVRSAPRSDWTSPARGNPHGIAALGTTLSNQGAVPFYILKKQKEL